MKPIFDIKNPRHMAILREELNRAKQILIEGYSADEIWQSMPDTDRNTVLYVAKATNPEELIKMSWDAIPADVQDLIDLSDLNNPDEKEREEADKKLEKIGFYDIQGLINPKNFRKNFKTTDGKTLFDLEKWFEKYRT